jgi:hypothetical protein
MKKAKQTEFPFMMDIRKLVKKPKRINIEAILKRLELPRLDHKYGYFYSTLQQHMSTIEYKKFNDWMNGQTCVLIDGKVVCYTEDVVRFLNLVRYGEATYWD